MASLPGTRTQMSYCISLSTHRQNAMPAFVNKLAARHQSKNTNCSDEGAGGSRAAATNCSDEGVGGSRGGSHKLQ